MQCTRWVLVSFAWLAAACSDTPTTTEPIPSPSPATRVAARLVSPAAGGAVAIPASIPEFSPGGVILLPGSGFVAVEVSAASATAAPWAGLNVYLLTGDSTTEYCGQNIPDAPTWSPLPAGFETTYTVTGFQVFQLPCEVTGLRAMLHTRNTGALAPPSPGETIAEAITPARFTIRR